MALDAGSVVVRVGANFEPLGWDRQDRAIAKAKAESARPIKQKLEGDFDSSGYDRAERATTAARARAHRPITQKIELDTGGLIAGLLAARTEQAALTKESGKVGDVFSRSALSIGQWTGIIAAAAPVVIQLGAALGALVASLGAAVAGLGALATGIGGAVAVGFGGIAAIAVPAIKSLTDLMTAQDAAHKSQATGAAGAARASSSAAQQIKSANEQVATSTRGVTTAEEQLRVAQESEQIAQKALTQARKDAVRELQDMRRASAEGAASEESARIALRRAQQALNQVMRDATASGLDIREAENNVTLARQNLRDVTIAANRAQSDYNTAQKRGIDQMPGVLSAQQGLDAAIRGVHTAQQGVAQAHRDVTKALENLTYQQKQANMATGAGGTAIAALALAERKAGPAAVAFANQLRNMGREWRGLTLGGRNEFFGMLGDGLDRLNARLPLLARSANTSMRALREGFGRFLDKATGPEFDKFVEVMTRTFANSIGPIGDMFGNIAKILQRIAVAVGPDVVRVIKQLRDMTNGWLSSTRDAGKLRDTIHGLVNQTEAWVKLIGAAAELIIAVLIPGMGQGKRAVESVTETLQGWTDFVRGHPDEMRDFFKQGLETTKELLAILLPLIDQIYVLGQAFLPVSKAFLDVTKWLNSLKVGNISALTGLLLAFATFKGGKAAVGAFNDIRGMIPKLQNGLQRVRSMIETVALRGMYAGEAASQWVSNIAGGIRSGSGKIRDAIRRALTSSRTFVASAASGATEFVGSMLGGIRSSRLADGLRNIFRRIALRMGIIWAATTAAAVAVGEGIGGIGSSLMGRLEARLPGKAGAVGRIAGRAFGAGFVAAAATAAAYVLYKGAQAARDIPGDVAGALHGPTGGGGSGGEGPVHPGRIPGLSAPPPRHRRRQHGGPVTMGDAFLVGEAGPEVFVPDAPGHVVPNAGLAGGAMAGLSGFAKATVGEGKRAAEGFNKALAEGSKKAKGTATSLRKDTLDEFEQLRKGTLDDTDKLRDGSVKDFDDLHDKSVDSTRDMRRKVGTEYADLERDHDQQLRQMQGNVRQRFGDMASTAKDDSRKLSGSVHGSMRDVSGVVFKGMGYIARATNKALEAFNVKPVHLSLDPPKLRQRGGHLAGSRTGDLNHAMLEDEEYVLNRNVVRGVGKETLDWLNFKAFPRGFQGGGIVSVPGFPGESANRKVIPALLSFARQWKLFLTDAYGPGHASVEHTKYGTAADFVPGPGGSWGMVGRAAQAAVRAGYTPVGYDGSDGTEAWSGHGPPSVAGGNAHVHVTFLTAAEYLAGQSPGASGGAAAHIRRLLVKGDKGRLLDLDQAVLDMGRGAANRFLSRKGSARESFDFKGGNLSKPELVQLWNSTGGGGNANLMAAIAMAESHGDPRAVNPIGGGDPTGLWQIRPTPVHPVAQSALFNPTTNAQWAHRILGSEGLQAWEVYTNGSYAQYLQGGGLVGTMREPRDTPGLGLHRHPVFDPGDLRHDWQHDLSAIPDHFESLFTNIGAGQPGGDPEEWLINAAHSPAVRDAQRIENRFVRHITRQMRLARQDTRQQVRRLHRGLRDERRALAAARRHRGQPGAEPGAVRDAHRALQQARRAAQHRSQAARRALRHRLTGLGNQRQSWSGRTNRRVEAALRAGYGQLGSFESARSDLFGTFGGNAGGGFGGGSGDALGIRSSPAPGRAGLLLGGDQVEHQDGFGNTRIIEGGVTVNNYFRETPAEPHVWARSTMYELRAAT